MSSGRNLRVCTKLEISKVGGRGRFTRVNLKTVKEFQIYNTAYTGNRIQVADLQDQSNSHYTI